jgi:hypothetical protein
VTVPVFRVYRFRHGSLLLAQGSESFHGQSAFKIRIPGLSIFDDSHFAFSLMVASSEASVLKLGLEHVGTISSALVSVVNQEI